MRINFFKKSSYPKLLSKINKKQVSVGVVGVGYVGQALVEGMVGHTPPPHHPDGEL